MGPQGRESKEEEKFSLRERRKRYTKEMPGVNQPDTEEALKWDIQNERKIKSHMLKSRLIEMG